MNVIPLHESYSECNNPGEYEHLTESEKARIQEWIKDCIKPYETKSYTSYHTSYGLKHRFKEFYLTNGQFKGAMLAAGFEPKSYTDKNWIFKLSKKAGSIQK